MKTATLIGAVAGFTLLLWIAVHADLPAMRGALAAGGWTIFWLLPYRALFFALYAWGWLILLQAANASQPVAFSYLLWVTGVREAVDRLMPVGSVGGSLVGVRLMVWRGFDTVAVSASVVLEIVLTLLVSYFFAAAGLVFLAGIGTAPQAYRGVLVVLLVSLPVPLILILVLRYGSVFERLDVIIRKLSGLRVSGGGAARLDRAVRSLLRVHTSLSLAGALELIALASAGFEIWFAMRLFGRPVSVREAIILESLTTALRHVAFIVPGGIGVQEAGLVMIGRVIGIESEFALALSMVKRARELLWGVPSLLSWQWLEGRRLRRAFLT